MTDRASAPAKDETSELCPSSGECDNLIDEIPSLDALSFEHEHCPSKNCLCHSRHHLQNSRNGTGFSAFGVQTSPTPILSQKPTSCNDRAAGMKDSLSSLQLAQPGFHPPVTAYPSVVADAVSTASRNDRVFGTVRSRCGADCMQSFAQVSCATHTNTSQSPDLGSPQTFDHTYRGCQLPTDRTHPAQEINLSELQSALLTTAEELVPVSDCPVHQHTNSVEHYPACTCGQQASRLDDCTFDELAAYLDNFCYIPKNMSPMAEMMYM